MHKSQALKQRHQSKIKNCRYAKEGQESSTVYLCSSLFLSPPLPLCPFLIITPTKFSIVITLLLHHRMRHALTIHRRSPLHRNKVPSILVRILMLLNKLSQLRVPRVHELQRRQTTFILNARVRPCFQHHLHEGFAKGSLGGGFCVEPSDSGV